MKHEFENGTLTVFPQGRIDSSNAQAQEGEVMAIWNDHPGASLTLDLMDLTYISSAGLRMILRFRKKDPSITLTNASQEVYDIFEMTGFTEMMDIHKAYRQMSVEGCEVLGSGSNGVVYKYNDELVVKVYRNPDVLDEIKQERDLARKALILGIPTAIPFDVVKVGENYASVFELLNAKSFTKLV
ncbi:MAG: STAS domain-containing protein, partial [Firmicutes bacterium]|nr:STAS domain-containing protein [Bacillota bacterium]